MKETDNSNEQEFEPKNKRYQNFNQISIEKNVTNDEFPGIFSFINNIILKKRS